MQSVSVYLRDGKYLVTVVHGSDGGDPCIASGPVFTLDAGVDRAALGKQIQSALDQSRSVPWPTDWKKVQEPLLTAAGVKSWSAFAKRASSVRVDRIKNMVSVRPSRRDAKAAFEDMPEGVQSLDLPTPEKLGEVVADLLAQRHIHS
jgi:hypothetical protein